MTNPIDFALNSVKSFSASFRSFKDSLSKCLVTKSGILPSAQHEKTIGIKNAEEIIKNSPWSLSIVFSPKNINGMEIRKHKHNVMPSILKRRLIFISMD